MSPLPPGLQGWVMADQANQQKQAGEMQRAQGLMQLQGLLAKRQQEQAFRSEIAQAQTPEQQMAVTAKYMGPDALGRMQQGSLDRKAALEAANVNAAALREQRLQELQIRGQQRADQIEQQAREGRISQAQAAADRAALQTTMARFAASLRQQPAPTVVEIADPNDPSKAIKIDARTREVIGNAPPKPKVERALPSPLQKQLTEAAELADATERFKTTFKPEYAGKTITGELSNTYGRVMGDDTGQAQWWQDYELHQSQVRNKLFGSALTAPEIEAWNKSAINPRMAPSQVTANLARRDVLEKRGLERVMRGAAAGGYNPAQIEAFTGRPVSGAPTAPAQGPVRMKFDAQGNPL